MAEEGTRQAVTVPTKPTGKIVGDGSTTLSGNPAEKAKTGGWKAALFVYGLMSGQTSVVTAIGGNLITYTVEHLHFQVADAANITSNFLGTVLISPIFWSILADSYFGPYKVIAGASVPYFGGMVMLVLAVSLPSLVPPHCVPSELHPVCPKASRHIRAVFLASLYLIAVSVGGLKGTSLSIGRQQFDETDPVEKRRGLRFFPIYEFTFEFTRLFVVIVVYWIEDSVSFTAGYSATTGISTVTLLVFFFVGTPFFRHHKARGSPFTSLAQVVVAAVRNFRQPLPRNPLELYEVSGESYEDGVSKAGTRKRIDHTPKLRFLDKAAIAPIKSTSTAANRIHADDSKQPGPWQLCTVTQVEELKSVLQLVPIFLCTIPPYTAYSQDLTFMVRQASSMDRRMGPHFHIPAATLTVFALIPSTSFICLYEAVLLPVLRRFTGHPRGLSALKRLGIALLLSVLATATGALVERRRVDVIRRDGLSAVDIARGRVPMSVFWLVPQNVLLGVNFALLNVAVLEFLFAEAPESLRSLPLAVAFASQSFGFFLASVLVDIVNRTTRDTAPGGSTGWLGSDLHSGGLAKFYWLLSIVDGVTLVLFMFLAHLFTSKRIRERAVLPSEVDGGWKGNTLEA